MRSLLKKSVDFIQLINYHILRIRTGSFTPLITCPLSSELHSQGMFRVKVVLSANPFYELERLKNIMIHAFRGSE